MKLSKRGAYALRALTDFGVAQGLGRPLLSLSKLSGKEQICAAHRSTKPLLSYPPLYDQDFLAP